jgi:CRP-like cAMP-binding protein
LENFFFKRITTNSFEKKYFNFFISNNYLKGDVLFNENNKSGFAYFIENGIVELSTSKSVIEMQMLIKLLQTKRSNIERFFSHFQQENEQELLYNNIENNCGDLIKYIKKKEKNKIIILKDNEDIGLISFFYDCPYIADCTVVSNTAKIYKIDFKYLNQILANENQCVYDLIKRINHKLKLFQERLFNINNIKLSIADKEETMKNKEKMELSND